ncbi:ABC transporter ATP-binding protein [Longispora fulva]|uniref:ABC-2 type transport system ATP-binding protein n=1 Tax=Longispora fulva TaxID=619741 RepID=A0A8J7GSD0_9ACTN|nr:ABC transporter ATP-binding protein [Longispora fulva]MBG6137368.1 ABC-2 type transport system ATP-binding protein [Longispora fulva]GIG61278.1 ABC transporter ATP-binding protein [Longispora fulva]
MADATVVVEDLVKRYPKKEVNAVDGLSFEVRRGEIFGLLGPNGAGKSTTIGVLTTRVRATGGTASVGGVDVIANPVLARTKLAVVPQRGNLDRSLTPRQNLVFHAAYHGVPRAERRERAATLLGEFGLADRADDKVEQYSGGMVQRVMIARALMHEPEVLFLDEPTAGLDPQSRLFLWDRVRDLRDRGTTIVLTTHDMDEAAEMSDRVGIIDHGSLLALDTPAALTHSLSGQSILELTVTRDDPALIGLVADLDGVDRVEKVKDSRLRLYLTRPGPDLLAPVATLLGAHDAGLSDVHLGEPSLEDVFINLTGRGLR